MPPIVVMITASYPRPCIRNFWPGNTVNIALSSGAASNTEGNVLSIE